MLSVTLRLLSLVALGAAQSSVKIWVPPTDPQLNSPAVSKKLVASVIGSAASSTTYVLDCTSNPNDKTNRNPNLACGGFPAPYTIVQGPSTVMWTYDTSNFPGASAIIHSGNCSLSGTTEAVCAATDGTPGFPSFTYRSDQIKYTPFTVTAGPVTATSNPSSASTTEHTKKDTNSTMSHSGIDSGVYSTTVDPSARTTAISRSSGLSVFHTGSINGISSVKASAPTSASAKSTNIGVQGSSSRRGGVFGALIIALAGAIL